MYYKDRETNSSYAVKYVAELRKQARDSLANNAKWKKDNKAKKAD